MTRVWDEIRYACTTGNCALPSVPLLLLRQECGEQLIRLRQSGRRVTAQFTVKEDGVRPRSLPKKLCQECALIFSGIGAAGTHLLELLCVETILYGIIQCFSVRVGAEFLAADSAARDLGIRCVCIDVDLDRFWSKLGWAVLPTPCNLLNSLMSWIAFPRILFQFLFPPFGRVDALGSTLLHLGSFSFRVWISFLLAGLCASLVTSSILRLFSSGVEVTAESAGVVEEEDRSLAQTYIILAIEMYMLPQIYDAVAASRDESMYQSMVKKCKDFAAERLVVVVGAGHANGILQRALIGGIGAGVLWTCQGAFFTNCCQRVAQAENRCTSQITAELAGTFALIFLASEAVVRASATILTKNAHLNYPVVFHIFGAVALISTLAFHVMATSPSDAAGTTSATAGPCSKAFSAVRQWKDPKTWFLQCTNLTFGFAAAWLGGYVGRNILTETLSSEFIGFAGGTWGRDFLLHLRLETNQLTRVFNKDRIARDKALRRISDGLRGFPKSPLLSLQLFEPGTFGALYPLILAVLKNCSNLQTLHLHDISISPIRAPSAAGQFHAEQALQLTRLLDFEKSTSGPGRYLQQLSITAGTWSWEALCMLFESLSKGSLKRLSLRGELTDAKGSHESIGPKKERGLAVLKICEFSWTGSNIYDASYLERLILALPQAESRYKKECSGGWRGPSSSEVRAFEQLSGLGRIKVKTDQGFIDLQPGVLDFLALSPMMNLWITPAAQKHPAVEGRWQSW
eukprot:s2442_g11.t1